MDTILLLNLAFLAGLIGVFYYMQRKYYKFPTRVLGALVAGIALGFIIKAISSPETLDQTLEYYSVIGNGYVGLLQMMIFPLVIVSILKAMMKIDQNSKMGQASGLVIAMLVGTTVLAALIGAFVSLGFGLTASEIIPDEATAARGARLIQIQAANQENLSVTQTLLSFIPRNPFLDMTGARSSSLIAVVVFTLFLGVSMLEVRKKKPEVIKPFSDLIDSLQAIVSRMLTKVLRLTPFGVLALIANATATNDIGQTIALGKFLLATYVAMAIVFIMQMLILSFSGLNPITFLKKVTPLLLFAFTSRSSVASVPLSIETQEKKMGSSAPMANLAATFGAVVGQNGCAGVYPAMLAVMIATSQGIDVLSLSFMLPLLGIVAVTSFGVAGVGGGATFAALMVLPALGLPVQLAGLLIAVEPLMDMGRTALNVNGSVTYGIVSAKISGQLDQSIYNDMSIEDDSEKHEEL